MTSATIRSRPVPAGLRAPTLFLLNRSGKAVWWFVPVNLVMYLAVVVPRMTSRGESAGYSIWETFASAGPVGILLAMGAMSGLFLPALLAQGLTRRRFAEASALALAVGSVVCALFVGLGFVVEAWVYSLAGWTGQPIQARVLEAPWKAPALLLGYAARYLLFGLTGMFASWSFLRYGRWVGIALLPATVGLPTALAWALLAVRPGAGVDLLSGLVVTSPLGVTLALATGTILFLLTRELLSSLPLRPQAS